LRDKIAAWSSCVTQHVDEHKTAQSKGSIGLTHARTSKSRRTSDSCCRVHLAYVPLRMSSALFVRTSAKSSQCRFPHAQQAVACTNTQQPKVYASHQRTRLRSEQVRHECRAGVPALLTLHSPPCLNVTEMRTFRCACHMQVIVMKISLPSIRSWTSACARRLIAADPTHGKRF
jgi:hypothetical protein